MMNIFQRFIIKILSSNNILSIKKSSEYQYSRYLRRYQQNMSYNMSHMIGSRMTYSMTNNIPFLIISLLLFSCSLLVNAAASNANSSSPPPPPPPPIQHPRPPSSSASLSPSSRSLSAFHDKWPQHVSKVTSMTSLPTFVPPTKMIDMFKHNVTYIPIVPTVGVSKDMKKVASINNNDKKFTNVDMFTGSLNPVPSSPSMLHPLSPSLPSPSDVSKDVSFFTLKLASPSKEERKEEEQKRESKSLNLKNENQKLLSRIILRNLINSKPTIPTVVTTKIQARDGQLRTSSSQRPKFGPKIPSLFAFGMRKLKINDKNNGFKVGHGHEKKKKLNKKVADKEIHVYTRPLIFTNDPVPDQPESLRRDSNTSMASKVLNPITRRPKIEKVSKVDTSQILVSNGSSSDLRTSASDHGYAMQHVYPENFNLPGPNIRQGEEQLTNRGYPFQYSYSLDSRSVDHKSRDGSTIKSGHNKYSSSKWPLDQDFAPSSADFDSSSESDGKKDKELDMDMKSRRHQKVDTFKVEDAKVPTTISSLTPSLTSYSYGHNDKDMSSKSVSSIKLDTALPYGYRKAAFNGQEDGQKKDMKWRGHEQNDGLRGYGESGQPSNVEEYQTMVHKVNKKYADDDDSDKKLDLESIKKRENERERNEDREKERRKISDHQDNVRININYNSAGIDAATRLRNSNHDSGHSGHSLNPVDDKKRKKYNPLEDESSDPSSGNESPESDSFEDTNRDHKKFSDDFSVPFPFPNYRPSSKNRLNKLKYNKLKDVQSSSWDYDGHHHGTFDDDGSSSSRNSWLSSLLSPITPFRNRDNYKNLLRYYAPQANHFKNFHHLNNGQYVPPIMPMDPITTMMLMSASAPGPVPMFPMQAAATNNQMVRPMMTPMMGHHHQQVMRLPVVANPTWMRSVQYPPMPWSPHLMPTYPYNMMMAAPNRPLNMYQAASKVFETKIPTPFINNKVIK